MKKLVVLAVFSFAAMLFALEAHHDESIGARAVETSASAELPESAPAPTAAITQDSVAAPAPAPAQTAAPAPAAPVAAAPAAPAPVAVAPAPAAPVETADKPAEKKSEYPKIKQSGAVFITPRIEITSRTDANDKKIEDVVDGVGVYNKNYRRLMFGWHYKLSVAVNEKLDIDLRLSDPAGEAAYEIWGSGRGADMSVGTLLGVTLPNAYFTYKPASIFNFSGGLLAVGGNTAIDYDVLLVYRDPTLNWANRYGNTLAGFKFNFPINKTTSFYVTTGISSNSRNTAIPVVSDGDTLRSYNDARIILGADLSFADKKVSLKPTINIRTRHDTLNTDNTINTDRRPVVTEGIDASIKLAKPFTLNVNVGGGHDYRSDTERYNLIGAGIEPVVRFGGEKGNLFTARVKYSFDVLSNGADEPASEESAVVNFIDVRFAVALNEKFSITPRFRYWGSNSGSDGWYNRAILDTYSDDDKRSRSFTRLELAFAASF